MKNIKQLEKEMNEFHNNHMPLSRRHLETKMDTLKEVLELINERIEDLIFCKNQLNKGGLSNETKIRVLAEASYALKELEGLRREITG